jgi:hypothetical protein
VEREADSIVLAGVDVAAGTLGCAAMAGTPATGGAVEMLDEGAGCAGELLLFPASFAFISASSSCCF